MRGRHNDPDFLREKAAQFRRLAPGCEPVAAAKLLALAVELETRAAGLNRNLLRLELQTG
jgi:hypothetical protein